MINETLYNKTVDILVQAYFNDTLEHSQCTACAVGNIIAANAKIENSGNEYERKLKWIDRFGEAGLYGWARVFMTEAGVTQVVRERNYHGVSKRQIDITGYAWEELAKIEFAFETAPRGNSREDWMFNGLMAVIEVLDIIHQNIDVNITSQAKAKFVCTPPSN